jgi:hypothetical protein
VARELAYKAPISGTPLDLVAISMRPTLAGDLEWWSASAVAGSASATNANTVSIAFRLTIRQMTVAGAARHSAG